MSEREMVAVLSFFILVLVGVVVWQRLAFRSGTQKKLLGMAEELKNILDRDGGAGLMVFTDNKGLAALAAQINRLLEKHRKAKAGYYRSEMASKRMLSNISHDIKTPMTVVLGYLEIMRLKGECSGEMLEKTEKKARNVMELIDQFFTLAKLESGDMDMEMARIEAGSICRETILGFYEMLHFQWQAGSSGKEGAESSGEEAFCLEIDIPEEPVYVWGNKEALQRILSNLISNVIRYGREGRYLGVFLREKEEEIWIDVVDKGKGIAPEFAESVFERLFTMDDSRSRKVQGNGLGLTIAKNLALQMGGDIVLESVPCQKTTFTLQLKKAAHKVYGERNS